MARPTTTIDDAQPELPDRLSEGQIHDPEVAERVLVPRKPQIGDTMPAPTRPVDDADSAATTDSPARRKRRRGGRGRGSGTGPRSGQPVTADLGDSAVELDEETLARQRGRERKGRPIGRYLMCVHVRPGATQIAVLEGRSLIEHYVSKPERRPDADPREHLPGACAERAAGHGGRVRRHRHAEERGALPR